MTENSQAHPAMLKMHLAIFIHGLSGGGATRRTLTLAEGFVERGHRVDLVVVSPEGALATEYSPGLRLIVLDSLGLRLTGKLRWRRRRNQLAACIPALARYLRHEQPDALLSAANHAHLAALRARGLSVEKTPLVLRVSNHLTHSHLGAAGRRRPFRLRWARRRYGHADAAIGVSQGIADDLREHTRLPKERIYSITNPTFTPDILRKAEADVDHPWIAKGAPPVILAAGRLVVQKDFATLLRAFAMLRSQRPARLIILGDGKHRKRLGELAEQLGIAEDLALPGFTDNPYAWMSRADLFVLSSAWEGSPGVLIEAMACGCPVVSTDCPSGPREILEGGAYGPLVAVGDADALAQAMAKTLDQPPEPSKLRARAGDFSVAQAVERYLEVLASVLTESR